MAATETPSAAVVETALETQQKEAGRTMPPPWWESAMLQIQANTEEAVGAGEEKLVHHVFGEGDANDNEQRMSITLLYRPGHYDILY